MTIFLLILHGLAGVALLGALTHQAVSSVLPGKAGGGFAKRYARVNARAFTNAVIVAYLITFALGAIIYPAYRLETRVAFEQMYLAWAVGIFELKEHWGAIGLALLPLYHILWMRSAEVDNRPGRVTVTFALTFIVWFDFVVGHVLNNIRGL